MPPIEQLQAELASAKSAVEQIVQSQSLKGFDEADQLVLLLERKLAAARNEEHAVPIDFPIQWDVGAPCPHVFMNEQRAFLAFYVREDDPNWDGTYVRVVDPADGSIARLALVEFKLCSSVKLGSPNDEVQSGHPLEGKGLEGYRAQEVKNSQWIATVQKINSVHPQYRPASWSDQHHYIFWFHDSAFECIATGFSVERFETTWPELMQTICKRLFT